jgi:hypothetical protein
LRRAVAFVFLAADGIRNAGWLGDWRLYVLLGTSWTLEASWMKRFNAGFAGRSARPREVDEMGLGG